MSIETLLLTQICCHPLKGKCISFPIVLVLSSPQNPCSFKDLDSANCWCCILTAKIIRERGKGRTGWRKGRGGHPLYIFSLQESNFPLASNSNCRTLGMHLIYFSVVKSIKLLQNCGWNKQWWITILSKRLRMSRTNFFHMEEEKKRQK